MAQFAYHDYNEQSVLLDVQHVSVDYLAGNSAVNTVHAVHDVSFTLHRGDILGLAGESGSGKSTLAYAITRLLQPPAIMSGGEIWYYPQSDRSFAMEIGETQDIRQPWAKHSMTMARDEERVAIDVLKLSPSQLRVFRWQELAIVFQSAMNALNPVLRVEAQIIDVLKAHNPTMGADACQPTCPGTSAPGRYSSRSFAQLSARIEWWHEAACDHRYRACAQS